MNITQVKVFPVAEEKLKAYVSIVLDDCFLVSDLKVIHGPNGLFISMPSKRKKNGEFKDIAHPLNRETRERMERRILEEYEKVKISPPPGPPPRRLRPTRVRRRSSIREPRVAALGGITGGPAPEPLSGAPRRERKIDELGRRQIGKAPAFGAGISRFES